MPTDKGGKTIVVETEPKKGLINRYGEGWGIPRGLEIGTKLSAKEQKRAEKSYINVRSDIDNLVNRGRYYPK